MKSDHINHTLLESRGPTLLCNQVGSTSSSASEPLLYPDFVSCPRDCPQTGVCEAARTHYWV